MTSLSLLFWIVSGIALQLMIYLGILFFRHWMDYQALLKLAEDLTASAAQERIRADEQVVRSAWQGYRRFRVERKFVENLNQTICSFYLAPEDGQPLPPYLPGQFLTFRLEMPAAMGIKQEIIRCYSLSDAPCPDCYRVLVKRAPAPQGSNLPPGLASNYFCDQVKVDSILEIRAPSGRFHLDPSDAPVVLIGSGIGITPMLSMLNACLIAQPSREVWLFYGVRNSHDLLMKSHLEGLAVSNSNFHLWFCFSAPLPEEVLGRDYQYRGRIDINLLRIQLPLKPYHFYICGPSGLMESLVPALEGWGVPDAQIHFEAFGPASVKRRIDQQNELTDSLFMVNFAKSGIQCNWQPYSNNLLELAEENGVNINSGCRAGSCGSCQTKLVSGEVDYCQSPQYDPEPGACLLCICVPKTNLTLEA